MKQPNPYLDIPSFPDTATLDLPELSNARGRPMEIEVGFGKGHFLMARARAVPATTLLGIETRRKWVHLVRERLTKHRIDNALVYHGDAGDMFTRFYPDAVVDRIFVNFPDPWWKARHEKRMVICPDFVREAVRLLKDNGDFFVQTDVDFRAEKYRAVLSENRLLTPAASIDGWVEENRFDARSLREKKCIETGLPVFRLHFSRVSR